LLKKGYEVRSDDILHTLHFLLIKPSTYFDLPVSPSMLKHLLTTIWIFFPGYLFDGRS
jgi:hypothetical protein